MYFLMKNLEELKAMLLNQCVNKYGCNCEICPYYNQSINDCDVVVEFNIGYNKIKNFLEEYKENIEQMLDNQK